jgi:hypothetical protein
MHPKCDVDCPGLNPGLYCEKLASKRLNQCLTFLDLTTGTNIVDTNSPTSVKLDMNIWPLGDVILLVAIL